MRVKPAFVCGVKQHAEEKRCYGKQSGFTPYLSGYCIGCSPFTFPALMLAFLEAGCLEPRSACLTEFVKIRAQTCCNPKYKDPEEWVCLAWASDAKRKMGPEDGIARMRMRG